MNCIRIDQLKPGDRIVMGKSVHGYFESCRYERDLPVIVFKDVTTGERYECRNKKGCYGYGFVWIGEANTM